MLIATRDLAASERFWHGALGLPVSGRYDGQVAVTTGALDILLDATGEFSAAPPEIGIPLDRATMDATLARLRAAGIRLFRGPKDFGGPLGYECAVRGPDGVNAVLFASSAAALGHVGLNVTAAALPFWKDLLAHLGFRITDDGPHFDATDGHAYLCVNTTPVEHAAGFHRRRTGLNHVALRVGTPERVDAFVQSWLVPRGLTPLYGGAREYPEYAPGYYAVYFEDPDRIKIEVVYESSSTLNTGSKSATGSSS